MDNHKINGDCDRELSLLNVDEFSNVNEPRIKEHVFSSYLSGHIDIRCPVDKKNISGQKHCFDAGGKLLQKRFHKYKINSMCPRLSKIDRWLSLF